MKVNGSDLEGLSALMLALTQTGSGTYTIDGSGVDPETNTGAVRLNFTFEGDPKFEPLKTVTVSIDFVDGGAHKDDTYEFVVTGLEPGEHYHS